MINDDEIRELHVLTNPPKTNPGSEAEFLEADSEEDGDCCDDACVTCENEGCEECLECGAGCECCCCTCEEEEEEGEFEEED
jgi:hypothetical protein